LSRDDLVESVALLDAVRRGELDRLIIPQQPLEVLAQQLVAETACRECDEDELYELARRAYPYRNLTRAEFDAVVHMVAEGYTTRRGRHRAYVHRDAVNKKLRARRGAKLTAVTSGGTIPDNGDYDVILEPAGFRVGSVNEDFAIESMAGDIFQLGNTSYRILRVEQSAIRVEDAHGLPPSIPFWLGEGLGRTEELSAAISRLRNDAARRLDARAAATSESGSDIHAWLTYEIGVSPVAAAQLVDYLAAGYAALGAMPGHDTVVLERFFDEAGDTHLVIHAPFGSRLNRAWGLALRKRFCRKFNFELQAAATDDAIILSLGATHSFPLE
jgi:ATP-dependent Lhr-like helicase